MTTYTGPEQIDTVVVGAGQAGLSAGYYLAKKRRPFVILDCGCTCRRRMAKPVGLAAAVHACTLQRPTRDALSGLRRNVHHQRPDG